MDKQLERLLDYIKEPEEEQELYINENGYICNLFDIKRDALVAEEKNKWREKKLYIKHRKGKRKEKEKLMRTGFTKGFLSDDFKEKKPRKYEKYEKIMKTTKVLKKMVVVQSIRVKERNVLNRALKYYVFEDDFDNSLASMPKKQSADWLF